MLKGVHLTLMIGGQPVPREVAEALTSVQVTHTAGQRSGFQLGFAMSREGLIAKSLLPSGFFDPVTTRVQIVVTMNGTPNVIMDGLIARHEVAPSGEPGQSALTVTGEDLSLAMDLLDLTGLPYPAMPAEARVLFAVGKYAFLGIVPLIIPSVFIDVPVPTDKIPTHAGTDLAYVKSLAAQVGYVFYVEPGPSLGMSTAYWGPEIRRGTVQPALSVNLDAHTNVESLSFSYDGLSKKSYAVMVQIPNTTFSIPIPIPDIKILRPSLAERTPLPFKFEPLNGENGPLKHGPIRGAALALAKSSQFADAVSGSGTLNVLRYGRLLKARALVDVRGAGRTYDGTYYVKSVTHNLKRGEYKQSFTLSREGIVANKSQVAV